jgi:hypothetical protein
VLQRYVHFGKQNEEAEELQKFLASSYYAASCQ